MRFEDYLAGLVAAEGSDLYLSAGAAPSALVGEQLVPLESQPLTPERVRGIAESLMTPEERAAFDRDLEINLAHSVPSMGRFLVYIFHQRNSVTITVRNTRPGVPTLASLQLPPILANLVLERRGLVLLTGGPGAGKSTTLAALIDHRNSNAAGHILTVEEPIAFLQPHKKSIVTQREVGMDTRSFEEALQHAQRQLPDMMAIDEINSPAVMELVLAMSNRCLCLAVRSDGGVLQAIDRILADMPEQHRKHCLMELSMVLQGIVAQRLVKTVDGKHAAIMEILVGTPEVRELIRSKDVRSLRNAMDKPTQVGMQNYDAHLLDLYQAGRISADEVLKNAASLNQAQLKTGRTDVSLTIEGSPPPARQQPGFALREETTAEPARFKSLAERAREVIARLEAEEQSKVPPQD